ncbi:MAG: hypothetical protein AVDCRST_MAG13-2831, partial [uncultured Solirubrobacteraceae bacterium]
GPEEPHVRPHAAARHLRRARAAGEDPGRHAGDDRAPRRGHRGPRLRRASHELRAQEEEGRRVPPDPVPRDAGAAGLAGPHAADHGRRAALPHHQARPGRRRPAGPRVRARHRAVLRRDARAGL